MVQDACPLQIARRPSWSYVHISLGSWGGQAKRSVPSATGTVPAEFTYRSPARSSAANELNLYSVVFPDGSLWLKLFMPALRVVRGMLSFFPGKRRWKLVFVERSFSGWISGQLAGKWMVNLRSELTVTNPSDTDGVVVVRVQIGRAGLALARTLRDCHFCDIAGERVSTLSPGVLLSPRTTATMQITHPFEVDPPPPDRTKALSFRVIARDQLNRRHIKRIKLQRLGEA
jgi:hypothetical protein